MQRNALQFNPEQQSLVCVHPWATSLQGTAQMLSVHKPEQHWALSVHPAASERHEVTPPTTFTLTGMFMVSDVPLSLPTALSVIWEL